MVITIIVVYVVAGTLLTLGFTRWMRIQRELDERDNNSVRSNSGYMENKT